MPIKTVGIDIHILDSRESCEYLPATVGNTYNETDRLDFDSIIEEAVSTFGERLYQILEHVCASPQPNAVAFTPSRILSAALARCSVVGESPTFAALIHAAYKAKCEESQ